MPGTVLSTRDKRLKDNSLCSQRIHDPVRISVNIILIMKYVLMVKACTGCCLWKHKAFCCTYFKCCNETCFFKDSLANILGNKAPTFITSEVILTNLVFRL